MTSTRSLRGSWWGLATVAVALVSNCGGGSGGGSDGGRPDDGVDSGARLDGSATSDAGDTEMQPTSMGDGSSTACVPGTTQPCYAGPAAQAGLGACVRGTQSCLGSGEFGTWGACTGSGMPSTETCDGVDNDCNGMTDDGIAARACTESCSVGTQSCTAGQWGACMTNGMAGHCATPPVGLCGAPGGGLPAVGHSVTVTVSTCAGDHVEIGLDPPCTQDYAFAMQLPATGSARFMSDARVGIYAMPGGGTPNCSSPGRSPYCTSDETWNWTESAPFITYIVLERADGSCGSVTLTITRTS